MHSHMKTHKPSKTETSLKLRPFGKVAASVEVMSVRMCARQRLRKCEKGPMTGCRCTSERSARFSSRSYTLSDTLKHQPPHWPRQNRVCSFYSAEQHSHKIDLLFSFPYTPTFTYPTRNPHLHLGTVQPKVTRVSFR